MHGLLLTGIYLVLFHFRLFCSHCQVQVKNCKNNPLVLKGSLLDDMEMNVENKHYLELHRNTPYTGINKVP